MESINDASIKTSVNPLSVLSKSLAPNSNIIKHTSRTQSGDRKSISCDIDENNNTNIKINDSQTKSHPTTLLLHQRRPILKTSLSIPSASTSPTNNNNNQCVSRNSTSKIKFNLNPTTDKQAIRPGGSYSGYILLFSKFPSKRQKTMPRKMLKVVRKGQTLI